MRRSGGWTILLAVAFAASALFAAQRYAALARSRAALEARVHDLEEARPLLAEYPEAFGRSALSPARSSLKPLVREAGRRHGVALVYLGESEKDAGKEIRERNCIARARNVPHAKLVSFLAELEARGGGARIKEIRLKPSRNRSGVYQEAESVLSLRFQRGAR